MENIYEQAEQELKNEVENYEREEREYKQYEGTDERHEKHLSDAKTGL